MSGFAQDPLQLKVDLLPGSGKEGLSSGVIGEKGQIELAFLSACCPSPFLSSCLEI